MAYHLSVVEIIHEINQQNTPPSPKSETPYTRNEHNSRDERIRRNLKAFIDSLPTDEHRSLEITINDSTRTLPQNNSFHVLCTDVSRQVLWQQKPRLLLDWKALFVSGHAIATGRPGEVVTGLEGEFCSIRESTAQMGVKRMNSLIDYASSWAVRSGVRLREVRYSGDYFGRAT